MTLESLKAENLAQQEYAHAHRVLLAGFYGAVSGILDPDIRKWITPERAVERITEHLVRMDGQLAALKDTLNAALAAAQVANDAEKVSAQ